MEGVDPHDLWLRDVEHFAAPGVDPAIVRMVRGLLLCCSAAVRCAVALP